MDKKKYLDGLKAHVAFVFEAAELIGVPREWIFSHDHSKWSDAELEPYAHGFGGEKSNPASFARAWLHHLHANPHHWQHWIFPDHYEVSGAGMVNGILPMPRRYYMEMICDWMGASRVYTGSWRMDDWLEKNMGRITLHPTTARFVRTELDMLGYTDIVSTHTFRLEATLWELLQNKYTGCYAISRQ